MELVTLLAGIAGFYLLAILTAVPIRKIRARYMALEATQSNRALHHPRAVFTLVHGTWSRSAAWTNSESSLCRALITAFGYKVVFNPFVWSGSNSLKARRAASREFRTNLKQTVELYPAAYHYIICHSHGGNVVLDALTPELGERVDGVVCLATPVIVSRKRAIRGEISRLLPWAWTGPALVALFFVNYIIVLAFIGTFALLCAVAFRNRNQIERFFETSAAERAGGVGIASNKVIFIRSDADEATSMISATHMLSWMVTGLLTAPLRLYSEGAKIVDRYRYLVWENFAFTTIYSGVMSIVVFSTSITSFLLEPDFLYFKFNTYWNVTINLGVSALLALWLAPLSLLLRGAMIPAVLAVLFFSVLLYPVIFIVLCAGLALGIEMAMIGIFREVTVESCPPGVWQVALVRPEPGTEAEPQLRHSLVHQSETALRVMTEWLSQSMPRQGYRQQESAASHAQLTGQSQ